MNPWPDDDAEVQEVIDENGGRFLYRAGRWYGAVNPRTGRWDRRMLSEPADAMRLTQRVYEKKMERQRREMDEQAGDAGEIGREIMQDERLRRYWRRMTAQERRWFVQWARESPEEARQWIQRQAADDAGEGGEGGRAGIARPVLGVGAALGGYAGGLVMAGATAIMPAMRAVAEAAAQPLGATGQASVQVGLSLVNFLANSLRAAAYAGGAILGAAIGAVFGPAIGASVGAALGFVVGQITNLFGSLGRTIGEAFEGLRTAFTDITRLGREVADTIMQISYRAGMAAESATRLAMGLQAAGVPMQTIRGMFGRWEARPEILGVRMGAFGLDYGALQRGDLTQLAAWVQGLPSLFREPMLRGVMGPGAEQLLPVLMRPVEELAESRRLAERWLPSPEAMEEMQQRFGAMQSRVELLGQAVRLHLLEGFLPVMERGLETLLRLWDENRDRIIRFAAETAPRTFLEWLQRAVEWVRTHWDEIVQAARDFRDIIRDIAQSLRSIGGFLRDVGQFFGFGRGGQGEGSAGEGGPGEHGPVYEGYQGARTLGWLGLGLLGIRGLSRLPGASRAASLLPVVGRYLPEAIAIGQTAWTVGGAYEAALKGEEYKGPDPFLSGVTSWGAVGFRHGGPIGAAIAAAAAAFLQPLMFAGAEILGGQRRAKMMDEQSAFLETIIKDPAARRSYERLSHEERERFLQWAVRSPEEARAWLRGRGEQQQRTDQAFDRIQQTLQELAEATRQRERQEVRVKAELEATVKPVVDPDFMLRLQAEITRRQIDAFWRRAQEAMA